MRSANYKNCEVVNTTTNSFSRDRHDPAGAVDQGLRRERHPLRQLPGAEWRAREPAPPERGEHPVRRRSEPEPRGRRQLDSEPHEPCGRRTTACRSWRRTSGQAVRQGVHEGSTGTRRTTPRHRCTTPFHITANVVAKAGHDQKAINKALAATDTYDGVCDFKNDKNNVLGRSVTIYKYKPGRPTRRRSW